MDHDGASNPDKGSSQVMARLYLRSYESHSKARELLVERSIRFGQQFDGSRNGLWLDFEHVPGIIRELMSLGLPVSLPVITVGEHNCLECGQSLTLIGEWPACGACGRVYQTGTETERTAALVGVRCGKCGYELAGGNGRCPECGRAVEFDVDRSEDQVEREHRKLSRVPLAFLLAGFSMLGILIIAKTANLRMDPQIDDPMLLLAVLASIVFVVWLIVWVGRR